MNTEKVTKTVVLPLETSKKKKNQRVREVIEEWQEMASHISSFYQSFPPYQWGRAKQNPSFYRILSREFPDRNIHSKGAEGALRKVDSSFASWHSNGRRERKPQFGDGNYCRFRDKGAEIHQNDRGYGIKVKLEPYNPEWWHIGGGLYQEEFLEGIVGGNLKPGSAELHLDGENLFCHLAVSEEIDVLEWGEVETTVGVDLGENVIYSLVVMNGDIQQVEMKSGREFRHNREQYKQKKQKLQQKNKLRQVKSARNQYQKYTDHVTHTASKEIVEVAEKYERPGIILEDLTHYRTSAPKAIHDWPYAELQEKILYKAKERGIPVKKVDPKNTSKMCNRCGEIDDGNRTGTEFKCVSCGYEVHADVNAAINISNSEK